MAALALGRVTEVKGMGNTIIWELACRGKISRIVFVIKVRKKKQISLEFQRKYLSFTKM